MFTPGVLLGKFGELLGFTAFSGLATIKYFHGLAIELFIV